MDLSASASASICNGLDEYLGAGRYHGALRCDRYVQLADWTIVVKVMQAYPAITEASTYRYIRSDW